MDALLVIGVTGPIEGALSTRGDLQAAARELVEPLERHRSPGRARILPGKTAAAFSRADAGLEGFSRPLWGLAPLAAGGGEFDHWDRYRRGLANGTDPDHPEYWGDPSDWDQKLVEMAAIGVALSIAPEKIWEPLDPAVRRRVADWLGRANEVEYPDGNWRFFRILTNVGLREVGASHDRERLEEDFRLIEDCYLDDGWYADGPDAHCDYYTAWEMHADGLVYAHVVEDDSDRTDRIRERAARFAEDFRHWFADDGAAVPYGRSQTYRFAQGAFWGALALAEAKPPSLSWGEIRRVWLDHLRWWLDRPIFTDGDVLSLGYGYPTLKTTESYNSPSSPYWGMKFFLPLALPATHPFWRVEESPPPDRGRVRRLPHADMLVDYDDADDHVIALAGGQDLGHYGEKYAKFAYSTDFGFGVATGPRGLERRGIDSTLALSDDGDHYRTREDVARTRVDEAVYSRWGPWPDVTVESWLVPAAPWHVRVHRLRTDRALESVEGGFAFPIPGSEYVTTIGDGEASVRSPEGRSGIVDPEERRTGDAVGADPNSNVLHPRTLVPTLRAEHDAGEHRFVSAVLGTRDPERNAWDDPPRVRVTDDDVVVGDGTDAVTIDLTE